MQKWLSARPSSHLNRVIAPKLTFSGDDGAQVRHGTDLQNYFIKHIVFLQQSLHNINIYGVYFAFNVTCDGRESFCRFHFCTFITHRLCSEIEACLYFGETQHPRMQMERESFNSKQCVMGTSA